MFMELLTGQAPVIFFKLKRIVFWGDVDQPMDFTSMGNTAEFTARAALDPTTPRFLRIAGDQLSARGLMAVASEVTGDKFRPFHAGSLDRLATLIKITRTIFPQSGSVFPAWQGMQYLHNMFGGRVKFQVLDNDRYPDLRWTKVRDILVAHQSR
jgi:nucleoside-diphosphate-sugar epimerase